MRQSTTEHYQCTPKGYEYFHAVLAVFWDNPDTIRDRPEIARPLALAMAMDESLGKAIILALSQIPLCGIKEVGRSYRVQ